MSVALLSDHTVVDAQNPWPGLSAYDEASERFFSGRDAESEELLRLVGQATLTVLFGKSGLGKTSLLQAGLFPRLRRRNVLPVHIRLDVRARSAPLIEQLASALAAEIVERLVDATAPNADGSVWEHLHGRDVAWWSDKNQPLTPLFVLDQFEEVFTLGAENPDGIAQLRLDLADLIENRIPAALAQRIERGGSAEHLDLRGQRYKLLISFREDFLPEVEGWKGDLPSLMRNRLRLLPMTADRALQAVSGETPTGRVHELVSDVTAREIVRFVAAVQSTDERARGTKSRAKIAAEPWETVHIEPALLSLVCEGLNGKRKAQGRATIDAALLAETGHAIIGDFYEACVADVPDRTRRFIEDALITEGGFRNSYPRADAIAQGALTEALLQQLVNRRLLRIDHQLGVERVELIHDRLTDVVRERRDRERERARRRQQRRRWWAASLVAAVLVVLSVSFLYLWLREVKAREQAGVALREAIAAKLVTRSRAILEGHTAAPGDIGLLLSAASYRLKPNNESYVGMQYALTAAPGLLKVVGFSDPVVAVSPDGQTAATVRDDVVRLWNTDTGQPRGAPLRGHLNPVTSVAFSPDGQTLVSGGSDRTLRLWDASTGQARGVLPGHTGEVASVEWSPDGKTLVSGAGDGTLRVWDASTGQARAVLPGLTDGVTSVAFSADGRMLAAGGGGGTLRLWDAGTGQARGVPLHAHREPVRSVAFSPDGRTLVSGSDDRTLRRWDTGTGQPRGAPMEGHAGWVTSLAFSPDGLRLVSGSGDRTLWLWDADTGEPRAVFYGHTGWVTRVAWSLDGKTLVSGGYDRTLRRWDAGTEQPRSATLHGHKGLITGVALTADAKTLVVGSVDGTLQLWDAGTGQPRGAPLEGHTGEVTSLAWSPDGRTIAAGSRDRTVRLWDAGTGQPRGPALRGHTALLTSVAFSPDGKTLVSGGDDRTLWLWDVGTGQRRGAALQGHTGSVVSVAFSPDGKTLVSGSHDLTVRLWDVGTGQPRGAPLHGHDSVGGVAVSPDGKTIAAGSDDGTLRLWDAVTGQSLGAPLDGRKGPVRAVAFSPDGRTLVSVSADSRVFVSVNRDVTVRRWDAPAGWIDLICAKTVRNLSEAEWRQHVGDIPYTEQCPGLPVPRD